MLCRNGGLPECSPSFEVQWSAESESVTLTCQACNINCAVPIRVRTVRHIRQICKMPESVLNVS